METILKSEEPAILTTYINLKNKNINTNNFLEKQKGLKIIKVRKIKKSQNCDGTTVGKYNLIDNTILIKGKINRNCLKHELNHMMSSNLIKNKEGLYQLGLSYIDNASRRCVAMDEGMTEFVAYYLNKDNPCGYKMSLFYYPFTVVMAYYSTLVGVDKAINYYMNSRIDLFINDLKEKIDINKIEKFRKLSDNCVKNYISPDILEYAEFMDFSLLNKEEMNFVMEVAKNGKYDALNVIDETNKRKTRSLKGKLQRLQTSLKKEYR